jgi:hypothetical protein
MFGEKHTQPGLFNVPVVCEVTNEAINDAFQSLSRQLNDEVSPALRKNFDRDTGELTSSGVVCGNKGPADVTCEDPSDWASEVGSELNPGSAYLVLSVSQNAQWLWAITNTGSTKGLMKTWELDSDGFPISTTPTDTASSTLIRSVIAWHATDAAGEKAACVKGSTLQLISLASGVITFRGNLALPAAPAVPNHGRWLGDRLLIFPRNAGEILWVIDCSNLDAPTLEHQVQSGDSGGETAGAMGYFNAAEDTLFIVGTNGLESWDWPVKATKPTAVSYITTSFSNNAAGYSEDDAFLVVMEYFNATTLNARTYDIAADGQTISLNTIGTVSGTFASFISRAAIFGTDGATPYVSFHRTAASAHGVMTFDCSDLTQLVLTDDQAGTGSFNSTYGRYATNDTWFWDWGDLGQATEVFTPGQTTFTIECQVELGRILFNQQDIPCADVRVIAGIPDNHGIILNLDADLLDSQEGTYYLDHDNFTNMANDNHPQYLLRQFANGTFKESFDAVVTSNGTVITLTLDTASGVTSLNTQFSDGITEFTTPATITCTAGTDISPQANYIYVLQSTGALTKSTSDWPTAEHIKVAYLSVPSATFVQANGVYVNQNWNDHLQDTNNQGHLAHMAQRSRLQGAIYHSGLGGAGTTDYVTITSGSPDTIDLKVATGEMYQMHKQTIAAFDTSGGDVFLVPNDSVTAYVTGTDLATFLTDAAGGSMSGRYYNLVLWGVGNKTGEFSPMMINLPLGSYTLQANAEADNSNYTVFTIPDSFNRESSTGFLIARILLKHSAAGGGTWTHISTTDLRGLTAAAAASGGGGTLSDHGALSGLSDDDHAQYLLVDGSRNMTGSLINTSGNIEVEATLPRFILDETDAAQVWHMTAIGGEYRIRDATGGSVYPLRIEPLVPTSALWFKASPALAQFGIDVSLEATDKLYFDSGVHTYIHQVSTDKLDIVAGGTTMLSIDEENDLIAVTGTITSAGSGDNIQLAGVGPNNFGGSLSDFISWEIGGAFTSGGAGTVVIGLDVNKVLTAAAGDTTWHTQAAIRGQITTQGNSEVIPLVSGLRVEEPTLTIGAGDTVTIATALYIEGAPTEGATNYALFMDGGVARLDSAQALGGGATPTLGTIGGSGPTAAGQNEWIEIHTQNGARFVPAWA